MIIGRGPELATLTGLLSAARRGEPGVVLLTGDPGMGKTALLNHLVDEAQDFAVLRSTSVESESEFPYAGLHELLLPAIPALESIPKVQAASLSGALALSEARGSAPLNIGAAVLSILAVLANERPVLCLIDDAQWLDSPSAAAMQFAIRRLHSERVAVVVASDFTPSSSPTWTATKTLRMVGLGQEDADELLRAQIDAVSPEVSQALWSDTGGNPAAMLQVASALTASQLSGEDAIPRPLPVLVGVPRWLSEQIAGLSVEGRRALLHASIAGTRTHRVIHRDELMEGIAEAEDAGLLSVREGQVTIGHRMTPSQVLAVTNAQERRAAHLQIAEALSLEGRHRELRLRHLAAAATSPDSALAAELAEGAGELSDSRGFGPTVGLLETAARLTTDDELRIRYTVDAARSAWLAGQTARAGSLLGKVADDLAHANDRSTQLAAALVTEHVHRAVSGRPGATAGHLDPIVDPALGVAWLMARSVAERDARASHDLARGAEELAGSQLPSASWAAAVCVMRATDAVAEPEVVRRAIGRGSAWEWSSVDAPAELVLEVLQCLTTWTPLQSSWLEAAIGRLSALAHRKAFAAVPYASLAEGDAAFLGGRWTDALVAYNTGRSAAVETGQDRTVARAVSRLEMVEVLRGRPPEAETLRSLPAGVASAIAFAWCVANAKNADALREAPMIDWPVLAVWLPPGSVSPADLVEVQARLGHPSGDAEPEGTWSVQRAWARALRTPDGAAALGDCLQFVDSERGFITARLLGASGQKLLRQQHRREAREQLRRAHHMFRSMGAVPWAEQIGRDLEATGARVPVASASGVEELTPRELQIARCIAGGATYKEVATELFLGVKTIEFHLGNVYRKLGIASRRELGSKLSELQDAP